MKFGTIVADPPWPYKDVRGPRTAPEHRPKSWNSDGSAVSSAYKYGSMPIEEIKRLVPPTTEQAHLYLWTTNGFLVEAHEIARAWGFAPKTLLTWAKVRADGSASMRTGHYFRGATEHMLFATKGKKLWPKGTMKPTVYFHKRLAHSIKPDVFFDLARECSPGPYLEMFARKRRDGWSVWGNEVQSDIEVHVS